MRTSINKMQYLLYVIERSPHLTQAEMAEEVGVGETTLRRWIEMLEKWFDVKLKRVGSARKGEYKIISWGVLNHVKILEKYDRA